MTAKQENKLSMFLAVKAVCDRNTATIQTLQAFADGYTEFTTRVANIQTLAQNQSVDATGLAADKQQLRKTMADAAAVIALAVNAYAKKVKNNDLAAQSAVTASDMTSGRDTAAADTAQRQAQQALRQHGAWLWSQLTVRRLLRCHPWHPGGVDLVPAERPAKDLRIKR